MRNILKNIEEKHMGFINEKTLKIQRTIDYEKEIYLISKGTNRENYTTFELNFKNQIIKIIAHREIGCNKENKNFVNWNIISMDLPLELQNESHDIINIIKEAIECYGLFYNSKAVDFVKINFSNIIGE